MGQTIAGAGQGVQAIRRSDYTPDWYGYRVDSKALSIGWLSSGEAHRHNQPPLIMQRRHREDARVEAV
jgi:hypothetical protein